MKLNLGCGRKHLEGYVNCDLGNNTYKVAPDVECDIRRLPFPDNSADEILAVHVFEHFYLSEVDRILEEWKRVLKPGRLLVLELPCLDKILYWFSRDPLRPQLTLWGLYGDPSTQKSEYDLHKFCWSEMMIKDLLETRGFTNIVTTDPQFHVPQRDMRVVALKPR